MTHIINLKKKPYIPEGFTLESHIEGAAKWEFDTSKIELFMSEKQKKSYQIGTELQKEIPNPFNANLFWFLLKHQKLIPEEWKKYDGIYFWGTILRDPSGRRSVLCLCVVGSKWGWGCRWLDDRWIANDPSASLASSSKPLLPTEQLYSLC
jgi:hypothetical protein